MANGLGSHEGPWAVGVFSETSTRQDLIGLRRLLAAIKLANHRLQTVLLGQVIQGDL